MVNNTDIKKWDRLKQKSLNQQFTNEILNGIGCSNFEAEAILETVHKIYGSYFETNGSIKPGQIQLSVVSLKNSPKLALSECQQTTVTLTLYEENDIEIRKKEGVIGLRRHKMERMTNEAIQQSGVLTLEDLAYRLFNCGRRTLCRDLKKLKEQGIVLPLRSTIKDMGRALSHRRAIIEKWLEGKEYSQISRNTHHSVESVRRYISKFKQIISLTHENRDTNAISFLTQSSKSLVKEYTDIYNDLDAINFRKEEIENYLKKNKIK